MELGSRVVRIDAQPQVSMQLLPKHLPVLMSGELRHHLTRPTRAVRGISTTSISCCAVANCRVRG